jgi:hypothetical protein
MPDKHKGRSPMFVYYYLHTEVPFEDAGRALTEGPEGWLPGALRDAYDAGEGLRAEIGIGRRLRLTREVEVHVGEPIVTASEVVLPIVVEAAAASHLFPRLDADLVAAPLGEGRTQISLRGSYHPPLAGVGEAIDRAVLHRVAEAAIKDFVERIADEIVGSSRQPALKNEP